MRIRQAQAEDIEEVMAVVAQGKIALALLDIDQWQNGYPDRNLIEGDIQLGESYLVMDDDGRCLATAMIACKEEPDYREISGGTWITGNGGADAVGAPLASGSPLPGNHGDGTGRSGYAVVHRVAVRADAVKKGAASLLLKEAQRIAAQKGCESVRVDTHPGNTPMQRLLEKNGFTQCGTIRVSHASGFTAERFAYEKKV